MSDHPGEGKTIALIAGRGAEARLWGRNVSAQKARFWNMARRQR
jgi:hypothetical protein